MKYQILVENGDKEVYTATVVGLPDCRAQASTPREALVKAQEALEARLARAEVVWVEISTPPVDHPWLKHAGALKDNPLFEEVQEHIAVYRRELDADPNAA